jgi:hypothetical protein
MPAKKKGPAALSPAHKAAMAQGRRESAAVSAYLEALDAHKPKRGRKRTPDSIKKRLAAIESQLDSADALTRVNLVQERMNLLEEMAALQRKVDLVALEEGFVAAAKGYSERRGISYAAWREIGISPAVLRKAGIGR